MKVIIFVLFSLLPIYVAAQDYTPFPEDSAIWTQTYGINTFKYIVNGDTMLNGTKYKKLYHEESTLNTLPGRTLLYKGAYRNDVSNRKVYYQPKDSLKEDLLYDFSLKIGDTLKYFNPVLFGSYLKRSRISILKLIKIDSVLYSKKYFKVFTFNGCVVMIEGIGNHFGVGVSGNTIPLDSYDQCFILGTNTYLSNFEYKRDHDIFDFIELGDVLKVSVGNILPNPASNTVTINLPFSKAELLNNSGKILLTSFNPEIDISNLPNGLYYFRVLDRNNNLTFHKLIKD